LCGDRTPVYQLVTGGTPLAEDVTFPEITLIIVLPAPFRIYVPVDIDSNTAKIASTVEQAIIDRVSCFEARRSQRRKIDTYLPIWLNATCSQRTKK